MIIEGAPPVFGNMHPVYPELMVTKSTISILKAGLALTDGFNLRAGQHHPSYELLQKFVLKGGLLVPYVYLSSHRFLGSRVQTYILFGYFYALKPLIETS
jgi:hypothetical protein